MGRENIYKTVNVSTIVPKSTLGELIDFLIESRSFIIPKPKSNEAFKVRYSGNSILSEIVHKLSIMEKTKEFTLIKIPEKTIALREVVDMNFIPFDILQMKEVVPQVSKALPLIPELDNKIVINVTDLMRANGEFSDITPFYHRVVRDFLSRSFYTSVGSSWISPTFVRYIAKVYNMTIGGEIARKFGLSPLVQMFIQVIFCLFFVGKMTSTESAQNFLKAHHKDMSLPGVEDMKQMFAFVEDTLKKPAPESLIDVCTVIAQYGNDQLIGSHGPRLDVPVLNVMFSSWFQDKHVGMIALEYPPYFAFLVMLVISKIRIGLKFPMDKLNLISEGSRVFDTVLKTPQFFNSI